MQEKISALVDGEVAGDCIDIALGMLRQPEHLARLDVYHEIRHALRSGASSVELRPDFAAGLKTALRNA